jgi:hypothetical protein
MPFSYVSSIQELFQWPLNNSVEAVGEMWVNAKRCPDIGVVKDSMNDFDFPAEVYI